MKSRTTLLAMVPGLGLTSSASDDASVNATLTITVTGAVNEELVWVGLVITNKRTE